jgi:hypothetical protein
VLLAAAWVATAPQPAAAARIVDLEAVLVDGVVQLDFRLEAGFDVALREQVASGLPTGITYELELRRDRQWFDRGLVEATLRVTAMYNALTEEYLVNYELDGNLIESRLLHDPAQLEPAMTRFERLPVFPLAPGVASGQRVLVRARAVLGTSTLLGFIPTRDSTAWTESSKFRVRQPAGTP